MSNARIEASSGADTIPVKRWWLEHVRSCLQGKLPSGRIGDVVFLLREQIGDILARPAPEASSGDADLLPIVDRAELIKLLEDLASVNLSREARERQARRMADDLIARGLGLRFQPKSEASIPGSASPSGEQIRWGRLNDEPYEYAIQQGPHGDEFVKLLNGECLRRAHKSTEGA
jgi:hypothetical protein